MVVTKTLSHYELLEPLGEGGMGTVFRAVDTRLGRPVAVKVLRGEAALNDESRKRFVQEAKAASGLNHPHIVTIYDIGQDQGVDFIAMDPTRSRLPTPRVSCTAISSRATSWSATRDRSKSSISGWRSY